MIRINDCSPSPVTTGEGRVDEALRQQCGWFREKPVSDCDFPPHSVSYETSNHYLYPNFYFRLFLWCDMPFQTDRTWELPRNPWVMRMTWSDLLFAHWPVDPNIIEPLLPSGLALDTRDGQAWIGIVPFLMSNVAPRCIPSIPKLSRFLELNVRTYVTYQDKPGVWFFSLDAASRLAVRAARATFNLPYMDARMSLTKDHTGKIAYRSERTHRGEPRAEFDATYQPNGGTFLAQRGSLEHWLTARYCLYCADRKGHLYRGEIDHEPWTLSQARYTERHNTMCKPLNFDLLGDPHLLFAQPITVRAWLAARCD